MRVVAGVGPGDVRRAVARLVLGPVGGACVACGGAGDLLVCDPVGAGFAGGVVTGCRQQELAGGSACVWRLEGVLRERADGAEALARVPNLRTEPVRTFKVFNGETSLCERRFV